MSQASSCLKHPHVSSILMSQASSCLKHPHVSSILMSQASSCLKHPHVSNKLVGSHPQGWLFLSDTNGHIFLEELLTNVRIGLPKNIKRILLDSSGDKAILSDSPNHRQDFIAIMLYCSSFDFWRNFDKKLAFWRNGDSKWSPLQGCKEGHYSDIAWSNDILYALKGDNDSVEIWDFNRNGIHSDLPTKKFNIIPVQAYWDEMTKLVVSSTAEILVVADKYKGEKWILVYKVDLNKGRCVQVETLDGQALVMVGRKLDSDLHDMPDQILSCISSDNVKNYGYKPNSIYFITWESFKHDTSGGKIKLRNYSLEDGRFEELWVSPLSFVEHDNLQPLGMFSLDTTM